MTYKEKLEELIKDNEKIKNRDFNKYRENAIKIMEIMDLIKNRESRNKIRRCINEFENALMLDLENTETYTELEKLVVALRKKEKISEEVAKEKIYREFQNANKIGKEEYNTITLNDNHIERNLIIEPVEGFDKNNSIDNYFVHIYSKTSGFGKKEHKIMKIHNGEDETNRLRNIQKIALYCELKNDNEPKKCILNSAQNAVENIGNEIISGMLFQNLIETDEKYEEYKKIVKEVETEINRWHRYRKEDKVDITR